MVTYLDLPFDVIYHLCSTVWATDRGGLVVLSLLDQRTRSACIPFLFMEVVYDRQWGENQLDWDGFKPSVDALLGNKAIKGAIKSLHFRPRVRRPETSPVPIVFFELLFSLCNLSKLDIDLRFEHLTQFKKDFNAVDDVHNRSGQVGPALAPKIKKTPRTHVGLKGGLRGLLRKCVPHWGQGWANLPTPAVVPPSVNAKPLVTLESLVILSPEWMFLTECSPNLTSLEILTSKLNHWPIYTNLDLDVVRLGKTHPNLKRLHCRETGTTSHIQEIAINLPKIEDLGLYGPFQDDMWAGHTAGIMDHLTAYNAFKHLRSLRLPYVSDLGMGYNPPWCGNAYFGDPGLADRLKKQAEEIVSRVMHGISTEVIVKEGSTLSEVVLGTSWDSLIIWEKGEKGELYESKCVERSRRTRRILTVQDLCGKAESAIAYD